MFVMGTVVSLSRNGLSCVQYIPSEGRGATRVGRSDHRVDHSSHLQTPPSGPHLRRRLQLCLHHKKSGLATASDLFEVEGLSRFI